jgi:hypothetical protein
MDRAQLDFDEVDEDGDDQLKKGKEQAASEKHVVPGETPLRQHAAPCVAVGPEPPAEGPRPVERPVRL